MCVRLLDWRLVLPDLASHHTVLGSYFLHQKKKRAATAHPGPTPTCAAPRCSVCNPPYLPPSAPVQRSHGASRYGRGSLPPCIGYRLSSIVPDGISMLGLRESRVHIPI